MIEHALIDAQNDLTATVLLMEARRDSLSLVQAFWGVQSGYFSFQRERSGIVKADKLLISAIGLPWQKPIYACR